jgi:hypothetical protein
MTRKNQELIKELSTPSPDYQDLSFPTKYSQSFCGQFVANFWKQYRSYWKNPPYNAMRYLMTLLFGLAFGTVFWQKGKNMYGPSSSSSSSSSSSMAAALVETTPNQSCLDNYDTYAQRFTARSVQPTWSHVRCYLLSRGVQLHHCSACCVN